MASGKGSAAIAGSSRAAALASRKPARRLSVARYCANESYEVRKNDSESCTWPNACEVCMTSPSLIAPLKKRCACNRNGNTTATWLTTRLKPSNFRPRYTRAHRLAM
ncbi:Uncharacterised protein [Achromobacter sp. 2789STDY5608615]|nr:Uncharacterised protein [Achromobacter sp. 2789STDY5608615]